MKTSKFTVDVGTDFSWQPKNQAWGEETPAVQPQTFPCHRGKVFIAAERVIAARKSGVIKSNRRTSAKYVASPAWRRLSRCLYLVATTIIFSFSRLFVILARLKSL
jgi:hypothetical protein